MIGDTAGVRQTLAWLLACGACGAAPAATNPSTGERGTERAPTALGAPTGLRAQAAATPTPGAAASPRPAPAQLGSLRWIAAAAGSVPESIQVQIEQDIGLAAEVFGAGGRTLFAAGPSAPVVQVLRAQAPAHADNLRLQLGDLFSPRGARDAHYRPPQIQVHEAATAPNVLQTLRSAVSASGPPLLVYLAGHGDMAEDPRDNRVLLWGDTEITVADLGAVLDDARRPVQLVATTCFSGGFGELVFHRTDPSRGAARTLRCGLFAAPWDLEASGCDPNPDRAAQQGYGLHFLHGLRQQDRDGRPAALGEFDLDGDGAISLLEAHTRVRVMSKAADVPTTTSERWLRHAAPDSNETAAVVLPEEAHVIATLSERLDLRGPPKLAYAQLDDHDRAIERLQHAAEGASVAEGAAYRAAAASLLARWPVLDDPWHPDFPDTLATQASAIQAHLRASDTYAQYLTATAESRHTQEAVWAQRVAAAPVERLVRALDNRNLAGRLAAQGGPAWATYRSLLACERTTLAQGQR